MTHNDKTATAAKAAAFALALADDDNARANELIIEFGARGPEGHTLLTMQLAHLLIGHLRLEHPSDWQGQLLNTVATMSAREPQ
jgi:hypothetical protein